MNDTTINEFKKELDELTNNGKNFFDQFKLANKTKGYVTNRSFLDMFSITLNNSL
jgi:hypothetical protein